MASPNIIVIMTDDQGYGDLSCMGATDFRTPHLDRMASEGTRFSCMYSNSPVCSPSRAALLTGRYPGHAGVRAILAGHRRATGLTASAPTLASALKRQGYHTGLCGKWHLGLAPESRPNANGFDEFSGFLAGCLDYYSHIFYWGMADGHTNPTHDLWENDREVYANGEYMTERITRSSVEFIRRHSREPFMLYVAYNAPHYPMHAPQEYLDRFPNLPWDRQIMAAMISAVDDGVGALRAELERQGIADNTLIYFQSDNGPSREARNWLDGTEDPYYGGTAGIFTGHKFSLFEGGIRVPAIACWPGHIQSGRVIDSYHAAMDVFPTVLEACGGDPSAYELDGQSMLSMLLGGRETTHDELYWEMEGQTAMRQGAYKLVLNGQLVEGEPERSPVFLSNVEQDPGEHHNLSTTLPDLTRTMTDQATAWRIALERRWNTEFAARYQRLT